MRIGASYIWTVQLLIWSCSAFSADFEFQDLEPLPVESMRVQTYSQEFADRFGLPSSKVNQELDSGIEAFDFLVQSYFHPDANYYVSLLRVYISSEIAISFPTERELGSRFDRDMSTHFFSNRNISNWQNEEDATYFNSTNSSYYLSVFIGSSNYVHEEQGFRFSLPINRFEREVVPGISFIEIGYTNQLLDSFSEAELEYVYLWLRRSGVPTARSIVEIESNDFVKIPIPIDFLTRIMPFSRTTLDRYEELTKRRRN